MAIKSSNITVNLGNFQAATKRREAYEKAMKKEGAKSLNEWCKKMLDKAAGYTEKQST